MCTHEWASRRTKETCQFVWSKGSEQEDEAKAHLRQVIQDAGYSLEEDFKLSAEQRESAAQSVLLAVQERPGKVQPSAVITAKEKESMDQAETDAAPPKEIFMVNGHDDGLRREMSEWVQESLGVTPIVLNKQLNGGKTLIKKFESYSADEARAIVVMTPDDEARALNKPEAIERRERQNVVFELGYFYGKLRRENIIVLNYGVELPRDIEGKVNVHGQDWKIELLKELAELRYKSNF